MYSAQDKEMDTLSNYSTETELSNSRFLSENNNSESDKSKAKTRKRSHNIKEVNTTYTMTMKNNKSDTIKKLKDQLETSETANTKFRIQIQEQMKEMFTKQQQEMTMELEKMKQLYQTEKSRTKALEIQLNKNNNKPATSQKEAGIPHSKQQIIQKISKNIQNIKTNNESSTQNINYYSSLEVDEIDLKTTEKLTKSLTQPKNTTPILTPHTPSNTQTQTNNPTKNINKTKKENPPDIVVYKAELKSLSQKMIKELKSNYAFKRINKNVTHVKTFSNEDYKKTQEILKENENNFFNFTLKEEKPFNVILKKLDISYDENDISHAIRELNLNINIIKITKYQTTKSKAENRDLGVWLIQLHPSSDIEKFMSLKYILHQRIQLEKLIVKQTSQCRRCQRFGHVASNCNMAYRCVKCTDQHNPGECPLSTITEGESKTPKCVNCGETGHPASYRRCPKYLDLINRKNIRQEELREMREFKKASYNNYRNSKFSYANITQEVKQPIQKKNEIKTSNLAKNIQNTTTFPAMKNRLNKESETTQKENNIDYLNKETNDLFGISMMNLMTQINDFLPKYRSLENTNEKKKSLISFLFNVLE